MIDLCLFVWNAFLSAYDILQHDRNPLQEISSLHLICSPTWSVSCKGVIYSTSQGHPLA